MCDYLFKILVSVFLYICLEVALLSGNSAYNFSEALPQCFLTVAAPFYVLTDSVQEKGSNFSMSLPIHIFSLMAAILMGAGWYLIVALI